MKYGDKRKPLQCFMTQNLCYKQTKKMKPLGVLWHSTGANNPKVSRYVQPSDTAADREELLEILGTNKYKNDWNHTARKAGVNCFIGKLANGDVETVQTMPWDFAPWGCGGGSKGSCNDRWIQFEICEAALTDKAYFSAAYKEAVEITAYLCKLYGINPKAKVTFKGVKVPTILCHYDAHKLGLGSNHGDVLHWFKKHGKTMDDVRNDVAKLLKEEPVVKEEKPVVKEEKKEAAPKKVYFPKCASKYGSIVDALKSIKANSTYDYRAKIAKANSIKDYKGTAQQNMGMLKLLKEGKLLKP